MMTMSPEKFLYELYAGRQAFSYADIFQPGLDVVVRPDVVVLGWCEAKRLRVRPRTEGYAIMVRFDTGEECWIHCGELPSFLRDERDLLNEERNAMDPEIRYAVEFGYRCAKKGLCLELALSDMRKTYENQKRDRVISQRRLADAEGGI